MKRTLSVTVIACLASIPPVAAQQQVDTRGLKLGDTVFVTDRQGRESKGRVTDLSPTSLALDVNGDARHVLLADVGRIERRGGIGTGTWLSTAFLAWAGMGAAGASCSPNCTRDVATAGALFGSITFAIGALHDHRHHRTAVSGIRPDSPHALSTADPVHALSDLWTRVNAGDTIDVRDASGRKTTGIFEQSSSSSIVLRTNGELREIPESNVVQVARRVDNLWTGALIGAALGAAVGARGSENYQGTHPVPGALFGVMPFMAFGALIGDVIPRHAVVYSRTSPTRVAIAPVVWARRKGLALSFQF